MCAIGDGDKADVRDCYGRLRTSSQSVIVLPEVPRLDVDAYEEQLFLKIKRHLAGYSG